MITLAGICQKRNYTDDWGENDVYYKRSTDFARHHRFQAECINTSLNIKYIFLKTFVTNLLF